MEGNSEWLRFAIFTGFLELVAVASIPGSSQGFLLHFQAFLSPLNTAVLRKIRLSCSAQGKTAKVIGDAAALTARTEGQ